MWWWWLVGWSLQEWLNVNWTRKAKELLAPNILALSCHFNVVRVRTHHDTTAHTHPHTRTHALSTKQSTHRITALSLCFCADEQLGDVRGAIRAEKRRPRQAHPEIRPHRRGTENTPNTHATLATHATPHDTHDTHEVVAEHDMSNRNADS